MSSMVGGSQDLYRLKSARRSGRFWILTFTPTGHPDTHENPLVVTVTDATYRMFTSHEPIAAREEILGMED